MAGKSIDLFFYGTLMDPAVLSRVARKRISPMRLRPAVLHGYERVRVAGRDYPAIRPAPGKSVRGKVIHNVDAHAARRIDMFEDVGYDTMVAPVDIAGRRQGRAMVYVASSRLPLTDEEWDFDDWFRRRRRSFLANLKSYLRGVPAE